MKKRTSFAIDNELLEMIDKVSDEKKISKAKVVENALKLYFYDINKIVSDYETKLRECIAEKEKIDTERQLLLKTLTKQQRKKKSD